MCLHKKQVASIELSRHYVADRRIRFHDLYVSSQKRAQVSVDHALSWSTLMGLRHRGELLLAKVAVYTPLIQKAVRKEFQHKHFIRAMQSEAVLLSQVQKFPAFAREFFYDLVAQFGETDAREISEKLGLLNDKKKITLFEEALYMHTIVARFTAGFIVYRSQPHLLHQHIANFLPKEQGSHYEVLFVMASHEAFMLHGIRPFEALANSYPNIETYQYLVDGFSEEQRIQTLSRAVVSRVAASHEFIRLPDHAIRPNR